MRPNRYPYTKNQWEEETTLVFLGDDRLELKVKRNRVTGEAKQWPYKTLYFYYSHWSGYLV